MYERLAHPGGWLVVALLVAALPTHAGQTPGVSSPWNGPWGAGYLSGAPYQPMSSPYVAAGYPVVAPYGNPGSNGVQAAPGYQPQQLPGGGYIVPPGPGGGILPGAYTR